MNKENNNENNNNISNNNNDEELKKKLKEYFNKNIKINEKDENILFKLNSLLYNTNNNNNLNNNNNKDNSNENNKISNSVTKINEDIQIINNIKQTLTNLNLDIENSTNRLKEILISRDSLQKILKEFNIKTKEILNSKEKMNKLISAINNIYNYYEECHSIQNFLNNDNCILKFRFLEDYEKINNSINFFEINKNYVESEKYLNIYNTLKIICINKYFEYIYNSISEFSKEEFKINLYDFNSNENDENIFYIIKEKFENVEIVGNFNFLRNYDKMKELINYFESKNDNELLTTQVKLKNYFIEKRLKIITNLFNNYFDNINNDFNQSYNNLSEEETENNNNNNNNKINNKKFSQNIHKNLYNILYLTILEFFYYSEYFSYNYKKDVYILQNYTNFIYTSLYNTIRPIIVSLVSLEDLINLFDAFSNNFSAFFINIENISEENNNNNEINIINNNIKTFFEKFFNINIKSEKTIIKFKNFLFISIHLIRPNILHLIQDIQEKIYIKINYHIKNNFDNIENDFPNFSNYELELNNNKNNKKYPLFHLYHFYLKRIVILYEIFYNKLDSNILNIIITAAIQNFIQILNQEIINNNKLNFNFQIHIIQQIIFSLKIITNFNNDFNNNIINSNNKNNDEKNEISIDFNFITNFFYNNYEDVLNGKVSINNIIKNSTPTIIEKNINFEKILKGNLIKSYKLFVNLSNEFIYGRILIDVYHKIIEFNKNKNNNDSNKNINEINEIIQKEIVNNSEIIENDVKNINKNKEIVYKEFEEQIKNIDEDKYNKIKNVLDNIIERIYNTIKFYMKNDFIIINEENDEKKNILNNIKNLFN